MRAGEIEPSPGRKIMEMAGMSFMKCEGSAYSFYRPRGASER
jgi:hypothetical protein